MDDKSTADQETQPQQSYLQQACPGYIPLLPPLPATQLHLYYARLLCKPNAQTAALKS